MYKGTINKSTVIIICSKLQKIMNPSPTKNHFSKEKILDNMNLLVAEAMAEIEVPRERVKKE